MLMSDSLYTVFSETGMFSWMHRNELKNTAGGRLLYAVRMILGLVGQHLFWAGLYIFVLTTPPLLTWTFCDEVGGCALDMLIHAVVFAVGIVLLIATGTWSGGYRAPFLPLTFSDLLFLCGRDRVSRRVG